MFLRRVQVPDFRVLKDVDITFEPEFSPHIFPIGSLNGGGKSTLLQLIFILLSCSGDSEKHFLIQNMLDEYKLSTESEQRLISFEIENENEIVKLDFVVYPDNLYSNLANTDDFRLSIKPDHIIEEEYLKFSSLQELKFLKEKISELESTIQIFSTALDNIKEAINTENLDEREKIISDVVERLRKSHRIFMLNSNFHSPFYLRQAIESLIKPSKKNKELLSNNKSDNILLEIENKLEYYKNQLVQANESNNKIENCNVMILDCLKTKKLSFICNFNINPNENGALLLRINDGNNVDLMSFLKKISNKIFLAAPPTQIFLFTSIESRKLLFKQLDSDYNSAIQSLKNRLSNFFTYDFLSVDLLIEAFKFARDRDFKEKIKHGEYGNYYGNLLNELNSLLGNKKVNFDEDFAGVNFQIDINGESRELYPEDLSHGELKRLGIYMWLKQRQIENSIVLMDEIENAFHPDWQYQIISDLIEWEKSNQYILATHSYELCQALTPAHIKELEPKLLPSKQVKN